MLAILLESLEALDGLLEIRSRALLTVFASYLLIGITI